MDTQAEYSAHLTVFIFISGSNINETKNDFVQLKLCFQCNEYYVLTRFDHKVNFGGSARNRTGFN